MPKTLFLYSKICEPLLLRTYPRSFPNRITTPLLFSQHNNNNNKMYSTDFALDYFYVDEDEEDFYPTTENIHQAKMLTPINPQPTFEYPTHTIQPNICAICEYDEDLIDLPHCQHKTCKECLDRYLDYYFGNFPDLEHRMIEIEHKPYGLKILYNDVYGCRCPVKGCKRAIDAEFISEQNNEVFNRFQDMVLRRFIIPRAIEEEPGLLCAFQCGNITQNCVCTDAYCQKMQDDVKKIFRSERLEQFLEDSMSMDWAKKGGYRYCPNCGIEIQRSSGCNHMYCIHCKNAFDWNRAKPVTTKSKGAKKFRNEQYHNIMIKVPYRYRNYMKQMVDFVMKKY